MSNKRLANSRPRANRSPVVNAASVKWVFTVLGIFGVVALCHNWLAAQPVKQVEISGNLKYSDKAALQNSVEALLADGMLHLAIRDIRGALLANDWVDSVQLRKRWPNTLLVSVVEQRAVAQWQGSGYLNYRGEAFFPKTLAAVSDLPALSGPTGAGNEVLQIYQHLSGVLAESGVKVERLSRNELGNFTAELGNGIALVLGSEDVRENINKFAFIYEQKLSEEAYKVASIDLRYGNGAAVAWRDGSRLASVASHLRDKPQGGLYER